MTPAVVWIGVATLAIVLKVIFLWAIYEDERLERQERRNLNSKKPGPQK
jgi:hypothetical protein